jgi:iron complex outermembrane receptor protein
MKKIRIRIPYLYCFYLVLFCNDGLAQAQSIRVTDLPNLIVEERLSNSNKADLNLRQNDIQQKSPKNLAQSLEDELGMSNSSFGQSANRPIIRGMSGSRVPIMQNGMSSRDVSDLSADHAVAADVLFNKNIEVLRGGESLRYSSSANQGLVNTIDNRIPSSQLASPSASLISQYNFNQQGMTNGFLAEDTIGGLTLHVDNTTRSFNDYKRSDGQLQPYSFSRQNDFGIGASYFRDSGFTGVSFSQFQNFYGIPSQEGSQIDLLHNRFSLRDEQSQPLDGFTKLITQFNYSNYSHQEISTSSVAQSEFKNKSYDARLELFHLPFMGWKGSFGLQAGSSNISATSLTNPIANAAIIPATKSDN